MKIFKVGESQKAACSTCQSFENASKAWVLTLLNKAIIIDPKGRILEGFGNFSDAEFESLLKEL